MNGGQIYGGMDSLGAVDRWIANLNQQVIGTVSPGHKAPRVTFTGGVTYRDQYLLDQQRLTAEGRLGQSHYVDHSQGLIAASDKATHLAIRGQGYFAVAASLDAGMPVYYTRDGEFHLDADGYYRTKEGFYLLGADDVDPEGNLVRDPARFGRTYPPHSVLEPFGPGARGIQEGNFDGEWLLRWQDPPSGGVGATNLAIDLGGVSLSYSTMPSNTQWVATPVTAGKDGFADVGWYSADTTADSGNGGGSMHYGAKNQATYASGLNRANTVDIVADWNGAGNVDLNVGEPGGGVVNGTNPIRNGRMLQWSAVGTVRPGGPGLADYDERYRLSVTGRADNGAPITDGTYSAWVNGATAPATVSYKIVEDAGTIHETTVSSGTVNIAPAPKNYDVNLGTIAITRGNSPSATQWVANNPTPAAQAGYYDVGWYSNDTTADKTGDGRSLHYGQQNRSSYAIGGNAAGTLDVIIDWPHNGNDVDLHIYEPDGSHVYYGARTINGHLNRDDTSGSHPGTPGDFTQWDEWYTVRLNSRADGPGSPSAEGNYRAELHGWRVTDADSNPSTVNVKYTFIEDMGTIHERVVSSGTVSIGDKETKVLAQAAMANRSNKGEIFSPEFELNPFIGTTNVAFDYSYALDTTMSGAFNETDSGVDQMSFKYRTYDEATSTWGDWVTVNIPKTTLNQNWTTLTQAIPSTGKSKVQFAWEFDTVDGKNNAGRGWNLENLTIRQGTGTDPETAAIGSVEAGDRRNSGSLFSPQINLTPSYGYLDFSFLHSYELDGASGVEGHASVDTMRVAYRLDGGSWIYLPTPKSGESLAWTLYQQQILTAGASNIQFRWDFDTVDGKYNAGRGWNLEDLRVKQGGAPSNLVEILVNDMTDSVPPGSTLRIYNPLTGLEGPAVPVSEGAYVQVPYGTVDDWPLAGATVRLYDDQGGLISEYTYAGLNPSAQLTVDVAHRRGVQPAVFTVPREDLKTSFQGIQFFETYDFANVPAWTPWRSALTPEGASLVRGALEQSNASFDQITQELSLAKSMAEMLAKLLMARISNLDMLLNMVR